MPVDGVDERRGLAAAVAGLSARSRRGAAWRRERERAYEREQEPAQAVSIHDHPPLLGPRSRPAAGRWTGSGWAPPLCRREAPAQGSVFPEAG